MKFTYKAQSQHFFKNPPQDMVWHEQTNFEVALKELMKAHKIQKLEAALSENSNETMD